MVKCYYYLNGERSFHFNKEKAKQNLKDEEEVEKAISEFYQNIKDEE